MKPFRSNQYQEYFTVPLSKPLQLHKTDITPLSELCKQRITGLVTFRLIKFDKSTVTIGFQSKQEKEEYHIHIILFRNELKLSCTCRQQDHHFCTHRYKTLCKLRWTADFRFFEYMSVFDIPTLALRHEQLFRGNKFIDCDVAIFDGEGVCQLMNAVPYKDIVVAIRSVNQEVIVPDIAHLVLFFYLPEYW